MDRNQLYQIPEPIETYPYLRWQVDARLKRYIYQRIPDGYIPAQVVEIAQILVREVQQLDLDRQKYALPERNLSGSITALLAHILFAQKKVRLVQIVEILQRQFQGTELRDVYQVSLMVISNPAKFLGNFQPKLDWYVSLTWYSYNKFQKSLTDELRRIAGDNFKRTNLGLLNRCSSSRLETSLRKSIKGTQIDRLLLLHHCFQETVVAKQFDTSDPQQQDYDALSTRYRERSEGLNLDISDRHELQELLQNLGKIVRNDRQPLHRSLDAPVGDDESSTNFGELLADIDRGISVENCEIKELALDLIRKNSVAYLVDTPPDRAADRARLADRIFLLMHGLGLNQTETGIELDCNQSTIGRHYDRSIAKLATEFYLSYHKLPVTTQISIEVLAEHINYIKLLCEDYYAESTIDILMDIAANMATESRICEQFIDRVETQWQFKFKPDGKGLSKVGDFINDKSRLFRSNSRDYSVDS
jgi:hypothetical protein